jgi:hypothetical protein
VQPVGEGQVVHLPQVAESKEQKNEILNEKCEFCAKIAEIKYKEIQ